MDTKTEDEADGMDTTTLSRELLLLLLLVEVAVAIVVVVLVGGVGKTNRGNDDENSWHIPSFVLLVAVAVVAIDVG